MRLFFIQIVMGESYAESANHQYISSNTFNRGSIFFSGKNGELFSAATIKSGYLVALVPKFINDPSAVCNQINTVVPTVDKEVCIKRASKKNDTYEEIAHRLTDEEALKIKALGIKGLSIYPDKWRFYPAGTMAAQVIGLLGYKGNDYIGRYGLERFYESTLTRSNSVSFVNFFAEVFSGLGKKLINKDQQAEGDLVTTIEPVVQATFEKELLAVKDRWHADRVGGIIMDPKTGEIVAMAALPSFDPNTKPKELTYLSNPNVENIYEMGSIVKPLTMAAGLDAGVVTASTTYNDKGKLTFDGYTIGNYDGRARGVVSMQEVLNQSLNTGSVFVMQRLGHARFKDYIIKYGIGKKTGIDLPGEVSGMYSGLNNPREIQYANASFGQGIAWTPIGITRALASLGNGGCLVKPFVVKKIKYKTQLSKITKPECNERTIRPDTSKEISRMLTVVVDKALAKGKISLPHYSVAAKTGTAQMAAPGGGYYKDRYLHSFFGYFPAYNPRFIIFMYIIYPKGVKYASETLTEPFSNMSRYLINYYEIPPDR
jgi:cell division protein FtsI/penicillin-binding protein 2